MCIRDRFTTQPQEKIIQCSVQYIKFTSILLVSCWKKNLPTMHSNIWTASIHFFQIFRQDARTCQKVVGIHLLHIYVFSPFYLLILGLGRYHIKIPTAILKNWKKCIDAVQCLVGKFDFWQLTSKISVNIMCYMLHNEWYSVTSFSAASFSATSLSVNLGLVPLGVSSEKPCLVRF